MQFRPYTDFHALPHLAESKLLGWGHENSIAELRQSVNVKYGVTEPLSNRMTAKLLENYDARHL
jgi:hypothetical protein